MPTYDFKCADCGVFSVLKPIAQRAAPQPCPGCGRIAERVLEAPRLALMPQAGRHAAAVNEKSRHEPRLSQASHPHGCGCGAHGAASSASTSPKSFPNARPWMISH
jgi:putative FmdB family regulatory protein